MSASPTPHRWLLAGYGDDVALATGDDGRLWIAASTATLATEQVWLAEVGPDGVTAAIEVAPGTPCCRPAVMALPDGGALAVACTPARELVGVHARAGEPPQRWRRALDGVPVHLTAAVIGGRPHLAVELVREREREILVVAIAPSTGELGDRRVLGGGSCWARWPAITDDGGGAPIVAWCEGPTLAAGTVRLARVEEPARAIVVSDGPGEAPALALMAQGRVAIAWHDGGPTRATDERDASVVRTLDVAIVDLARMERTPATPPVGAGGVAPAGEDQGWELPALAADADGALWLVGRSTHGHHVACREREGTWSPSSALCNEDWGGRGRRHALVARGREVWLARRAPAGIEVGPCPRPQGGPAAPAPRPAARPARLPPRALAGIRFGDLHQHTAHSDGCGSFEDLWIAARDRRGLDFAAITDHDQFCRRALGPATWQLASQIAASFDEPGRFVALAAYELTLPRHPGPGHKCVYFGERVPDRVPERDLPTLFALLREVGGIAVPHHVGWTGGDFAHHDPELQPIWEICSVHGCYEGLDRDGHGCGAHPPRADYVIPGQFVRDALDAGLRFGFIGSTDSHGLDWHHGIAPWRNPFRAGLACVLDAEPTRDGVLAALRARRTYATSGARIGLRVELAGAPMGSELPRDAAGELVVEVDGTAPISRIAAVHRGGEHTLEGTFQGARACVRAPIASVLPASESPRYVYVRVEQADGEHAWSSPFWT